MRSPFSLGWLIYAAAMFWASAGAVAGTADLVVFRDSFENGFQNQYWASLSPTNTEPVHSGAFSISVSPADYWQGVYFHHSGFDTTRYSSLSFWIYGGSSDGERLEVQGLSGEENPLADVYYRFTAPLGRWEQVVVPLATLGIDQKTNCTGFWILLVPEGSSNGVFYLDDVQFNTAPPPVPARGNGEAGGSRDISEASARVVAPGPPPVENRDWLLGIWSIAGILVVMAILLAWLVVTLRRSGLFNSKALVPRPPSAAARVKPGVRYRPGTYPMGPATAEIFAAGQTQEVRERVALELAEFAKQSLIQGLYAQKAQLMQSQEKAQEELAALEARLAMLQLPLTERIRAYEARIAELEKQLETRDQEMRNMIQTTLSLVRERLQEEKTKGTLASRLN
jgi:hypothetical protein